jgi:TPP-dependent 2-oxoacid decarboxylase
VLKKIGVKQIFGLIGDSHNPIVDAVRHSNVEWIGVRHEEGAALGYVARELYKTFCAIAVKSINACTIKHL